MRLSNPISNSSLSGTKCYLSPAERGRGAGAKEKKQIQIEMSLRDIHICCLIQMFSENPNRKPVTSKTNLLDFVHYYLLPSGTICQAA